MSTIDSIWRSSQKKTSLLRAAELLRLSEAAYLIPSIFRGFLPLVLGGGRNSEPDDGGDRVKGHRD